MNVAAQRPLDWRSFLLAVAGLALAGVADLCRHRDPSPAGDISHLTPAATRAYHAHVMSRPTHHGQPFMGTWQCTAKANRREADCVIR